MRAVGPVEIVDLHGQGRRQFCGGAVIGGQIEVGEFLPHDPGGHGVDVEPLAVAAQAVGLDQRRSAAHEGVSDLPTREGVGLVEDLPQRVVTELGQGQGAEQGSRPAREPLVHGDDGPVVLLNLLFLEGQGGNEGDVEGVFDGHGYLGCPAPLRLGSVARLRAGGIKGQVDAGLARRSMFGGILY